MLAAPREGRLGYFSERLAAVDAATVDIEARPFEGKSRFRIAESLRGAFLLHQIFGIAPIEDCEGSRQSHRVAVQPQEPTGDGVKRAAPNSTGDGAGVDRAPQFLARALKNLIDAAQHFGRRASGEGQKQNATRIG